MELYKHDADKHKELASKNYPSFSCKTNTIKPNVQIESCLSKVVVAKVEVIMVNKFNQWGISVSLPWAVWLKHGISNCIHCITTRPKFISWIGLLKVWWGGWGPPLTELESHREPTTVTPFNDLFHTCLPIKSEHSSVLTLILFVSMKLTSLKCVSFLLNI